MAGFPFLGWAAVYYAALFPFYYLFFHGYFSRTLERQLLGLRDTLLLTLALILYLALALIPALMWGRRNCNHPLWSGIEAFLCYAVVFLALGGITMIFDTGDWSALSGISAGASPWIRALSLLSLLALFLVLAWRGSVSARSWRPDAGKRREAEERG